VAARREAPGRQFLSKCCFRFDGDGETHRRLALNARSKVSAFGLGALPSRKKICPGLQDGSVVAI
jgi:hypothetical protein